ncbi:MAG: TetR/AcrR family transcriptional regulator [Acidobacteriota bacterium]
MGIKERHDRERQAVREAILDAARDLFIAEGYRNVSIRKIAERVEYSPAALYGYFPSKDDIFFALAEEGFRRLVARIREVPPDADPLVELGAAWWAYYEFSKEHREFFELMFVERSVPQLTRYWGGFTYVQDLLVDAERRIQRCIDAGILPPSTNAAVAMHVLWGALTGPAILANGCRLAPDEDPDALARDVLDTTLAGLRAGVTLRFVPCNPFDLHSSDPQEAGEAAPAGVRRHDS